MQSVMKKYMKSIPSINSSDELFQNYFKCLTFQEGWFWNKTVKYAYITKNVKMENYIEYAS